MGIGDVLIIVGIVALTIAVGSWIGLILVEGKLYRDTVRLQEMIDENFQQPD